MSPLEASNPITVDPEKCNVADAQDKDFRIAIMNMFKLLKKNMNKYNKEIYETSNSGME